VAAQGRPHRRADRGGRRPAGRAQVARTGHAAAEHGPGRGGQDRAGAGAARVDPQRQIHARIEAWKLVIDYAAPRS
jgi:hypothetical protein